MSGKTVNEMAKIFGRDPRTIERWIEEAEMPKEKRPLLPSEKTRIRELSYAGKTPRQIAEIVGRPETTIHTALRYMNNGGTPHASICWDCINAVPNPETGDGCSWSRSFIPVEGWTAREHKLMIYGDTADDCMSYQVISCPCFKEG